MSSHMTLSVINPDYDKRWDQFVESHPEGSIFHHSTWKRVLQESFGYVPFYVAMENPNDGRVEGILPFMRVKSQLTGTRLVSLPFTSYCTRLFPEAMLEKAVIFAYENYPDTAYLELKLFNYLEKKPELLEIQSEYVTHILNLDARLEDLYKSFHNTSICQRIRKGNKSGIRFKMADNEEGLKAFFRLHAKVRKRHGLPPHPYKFFLNMLKILAPRNIMCIPLIEYGGTIVAGAIVLKFKDTFHFEYSAFDRQYAHISPNQFMIWEIIKLAQAEGARHFDFGRSAPDNKSLIEFKKRWGAEQHELHYYYYPKAKRVNTESGVKKYMLSRFNSLLPPCLLRLEGEILYPHIG